MKNGEITIAGNKGKGLLNLADMDTGSLDMSAIDLRQFNQLVIFVLDGSGSMTWPGETGQSKGEEVDSVIKSVIDRLASSKNKSCFDVEAYAFAKDNGLITNRKTVKDINSDVNFDAVYHVGDHSATFLEETLLSVEQSVANYLAAPPTPGVLTQAVVLILSDGALHDFEKSVRVANRLKIDNRVTVSSIYFHSAGVGEDQAAEAQEMMRQISSTELLYSTTARPEDIRDHMIKSIKSSFRGNL